MAYLLLENGMAFEGKRIGAQKAAAGELVFTTGVVGYVEQLTDPANAGKILMQTFPLIGNYGVAEEDAESEYTPAGYVVRNLCETPSNFRSEMDVNAFLQKKGIPGIAGVDTRHLTKVLRDQGSMKAIIVDELPKSPSFDGETPALLSCKRACFAAEEEKARVVLWDLGAKNSLIRTLNGVGFSVERMPYSAKAEDILQMKPDAVVLSGGMEQAEEGEHILPELKKLLGKVPMLSVGLGHLLVAKALGGRVNRLPSGHRGQNQPVFCTLDGLTSITCQNHAFAVDAQSLAGVGTMIYKNLNDQSCEGMYYPSLRCLCVQFDPDEQVLCHFAARMGGEQDA